eukprot:1136791-Pelagomonas_calceolata.AAC.2
MGNQQWEIVEGQEACTCTDEFWSLIECSLSTSRHHACAGWRDHWTYRSTGPTGPASLDLWLLLAGGQGED